MSDAEDIEAAARAAFETLDEGSAEVATEARTAPEPAEEGPTRDEKGRFASKVDNVQEVDQPSPAPNGAEPQDETIRPPKSWKAAAKAAFGQLPPDVRAEILRREGEIDAGKAQWDQKAAEYNRFDELFQPIDQRLSIAGVDRAGYIRALITADNMLRSNPQQALQLLSQQYGFQLPGAQAQQFQAQSYIDPTVQTLQQQVAQLSGQFQSQQQAQEQAERAQAEAQIKAFADDPKNIYFENVKASMGQLMRINPDLTLQQAYDKACRMDDEVWTAMQAKPLPKAQPGRPKDIQATGAKGQSAPTAPGGRNASYEAAARAAFEELEGRVR